MTDIPPEVEARLWTEARNLCDDLDLGAGAPGIVYPALAETWATAYRAGVGDAGSC